MKEGTDVIMEKIISLAKRRGFVYPGSEIYGGFANSWDYGPLGVALRQNIKKEWWRMFVEERDDMYGLDGGIIMSRKIWAASGHEKTFSDPLTECKKCHTRFREDDHAEKKCPVCGSTTLAAPKQFNLMFKTYVGPTEEDANISYLRPETAQAMFVDFKQILDSFSPKLPFGMAQIGKAFRNEITPGNFIFRTREFEQMEIEYFVHEKDWERFFEEWTKEMNRWMNRIGLDMEKVHELEVPDSERAHYSRRTIDFEFDFPFGRKELYGLAYRGDFDLKNHEMASGKDLKYFDEEAKERFLPHVIEPSLGVDRTMLALLCSGYREENDEKGEVRIYLDMSPLMAPYKAAVFPLLANKEELVKKARQMRSEMQGNGMDFVPIAFDSGGNIGKRYRKQDEIGTPYCFTVDFQTLQDNTVTIRDRNTMKQERMPADTVGKFIREKLK